MGLPCRVRVNYRGYAVAVQGKMISASACSRDERAEVLGCPTPNSHCEVCSVSLPLAAWNMPNAASEIVRPHRRRPTTFLKVNF